MLVTRFPRLKNLEPCHLLFISSSEKTNYAEIMKKVKNSSVLTVGETDGLIDQGGIITFYELKKKVRFKINTDAAKTASLKFSSRLLKLAVIVKNKKK